MNIQETKDLINQIISGEFYVMKQAMSDRTVFKKDINNINKGIEKILQGHHPEASKEEIKEFIELINKRWVD